jgi:hypothetical protein
MAVVSDEIWNRRDPVDPSEDEMFRVDVNGFMSIQRQDASGRCSDRASG